MGSAELDEFVGRVAERTDIYSVVSQYVPLTQKGGRYWGRCPFHNEKTASFSVSADKGLFYCFGCGTGGNVFKFLSLIENITYFEAIKLQAQRLGIDLPAKKLSPEEERRRREEKALFKINELARDFYHECLIKTARGEVGRKYLAARGITPETIENFKMGYAPDEWESLFRKLTRQDFSPQQLEAVGLVAKRKNSSGYYDRFRGRVMIPITDVFGHVVGFGGRILNAQEDTAKYLNTPETALFNKRKLLFGLDKSNREISAAGKAVVVEGYMDAISLFSAGIKNVVATLGTAFTPEHADLILRYARKIIFCYDSDEAGQRATVKALPIVQAAGAEVFVISIPDGKDPDEFIRKHGKEEFEELIKTAEPLTDYRMNYVLARADLFTISGRLQALREILPVFAKFKEKLKLNQYIKKLSLALSVDETDILSEWKKLSYKERQEPRAPKKAVVINKQPDNRPLIIKRACEDLLRMAWHEPDLLDYVFAMVPREIFTQVQREIIAWFEDCREREKIPDQVNALTELSNEASAEISRILLDQSAPPHEIDVASFEDAVKVLRLDVLTRTYAGLRAQAEKISDDNAAHKKVFEESLKIKKELEKLQRKT